MTGLVIAAAGFGSAIAKTGEGAAEGVNLQADGLVDLQLPLVSVAASGVDGFDESSEIFGVDETLPLLGAIAADVISASTRHAPFEHRVEADAMSSGLEVDLGINVLGLVDIPILGLTSGTLASEAEVAGACDSMSAAGSATIEDLSLTILGLDQSLDIPINPPPNFEVINQELVVPIGIASVAAQVLAIANEQDVAADGSAISVNALRITIGLEISVLAVTVEQDINLVVARSQAGFSDCNEVDLAVEKTTDLDGDAVLGEPFNYTVTIDNNSSVDATIVEITDQLPPELEFVSFIEQSGGDCSHDAGMIVCRWLMIPAGGGVSVAYQVLPVATGTVTNSVGVSTGDINIGDPGDDDEVVIGDGIELSMEKSIDHEPLVVGQPFNYVFDYINHGVNDATQVDFADLLPSGIAITGAPDNGACTVDGLPAEFPLAGDGETVLVCVIEVTVTAGGGTAAVMLPALATAAGEQPVNHATWSDNGGGNPEDPNPGCEDNVNCDSTTPEDPIGNGVELSMEKSIDHEPLVVGQPFNYVFDYINHGVNDATQVDFADLLPSGIAITGAPDNGACTVDGLPAEFPLAGDGETVLVCVIEVTVTAGGGTAAVMLPALATAAGEQPVNHATWSDNGGGNPEDPNPGCEDNVNCDSTTPEDPIGNGVELSMEKSIDHEPLVVGQPFNYVFDYINHGVNDATQVDFADLIPAGIAITGAPEDGMCTVDGATAEFPLEGDGVSVLVCVIGVAVSAGGGSAQVLLPARPLAAAEGTVPVNHASWGSDGGGNPVDPDPETCEADPNCDVSAPEDPVQPAPFSDLEVAVVVDPDPGREGEPMSYTILIGNAGTETAGEVTMTLDFDGVPVTIDAATLPDGCTLAGTLVTCEAGDIEPGTMVEIAIVVTPEGTGTLVASGGVEDADGNAVPISSSTTILEPVFNDIFSDRFES